MILRPMDDGLAMHQLHFKAEVRSIKDLGVEAAPVSDAELKLANQLIDQLAAKRFDPNEYVDEHRARVEAAIQRKVEGKEVSFAEPPSRRRRLQRGRSDGSAEGEPECARRQGRGEGAQGAQEGVGVRVKPRLPRKRPSDEVRCRSTRSPTSRDCSVSLRRSSAKLSQAGFITPPAASGKTSEQDSYTFQDLLVLRVAGALKAAKMSTPKIVAALEQIRGALPTGRLPAIALAASGKRRRGARRCA